MRMPLKQVHVVRRANPDTPADAPPLPGDIIHVELDSGYVHAVDPVTRLATVRRQEFEIVSPMGNFLVKDAPPSPRIDAGDEDWEQVTRDQLREGDMVRTMMNVHAPDPPVLYWRRVRPPVVAVDHETGISIRFVQQYDAVVDQQPTRFDVETYDYFRRRASRWLRFKVSVRWWLHDRWSDNELPWWVRLGFWLYWHLYDRWRDRDDW